MLKGTYSNDYSSMLDPLSCAHNKRMRKIVWVGKARGKGLPTFALDWVLGNFNLYTHTAHAQSMECELCKYVHTASLYVHKNVC